MKNVMIKQGINLVFFRDRKDGKGASYPAVFSLNSIRPGKIGYRTEYDEHNAGYPLLM